MLWLWYCVYYLPLKLFQHNYFIIYKNVNESWHWHTRKWYTYTEWRQPCLPRMRPLNKISRREILRAVPDSWPCYKVYYAVGPACGCTRNESSNRWWPFTVARQAWNCLSLTWNSSLIQDRTLQIGSLQAMFNYCFFWQCIHLYGILLVAAMSEAHLRLAWWWYLLWYYLWWLECDRQIMHLQYLCTSTLRIYLTMCYNMLEGDYEWAMSQRLGSTMTTWLTAAV